MIKSRQKRFKSLGWDNLSIAARKPFCNALQSFCNGIPTLHIFSNEAQTEELIFQAGGIEELTEASNDAVGWYRLASYRDYPHPKGIQRMTHKAAADMVQNFSNAASRVKRFFGAHKPAIYRSHPDDGAYPNADDTTVYGNIDDMAARDDGLYAHIAWSNSWETLKKEGKWRFSPRWAARKIPGPAKIVEPIRLISVGLTETPNLPDAAFANSKIETQMNELLKTILTKLGFASDRIDATLAGGENAITAEEIQTALDKLTADKAAEAKTAQADAQQAKADLAAVNSKLTAAEAEKAKAIETAANERRGRATMAVDEAIGNGRITAAERSEWQKKLNDATDWETAANELSSAKPKVHTASQFGDQGARRQTSEIITASNEFRTLVDADMKASDHSFDRAWDAVSMTEKGKALLKRMEPPKE